MKKIKTIANKTLKRIICYYPIVIHNWYAKLCKKKTNKSIILLSFDCDNIEDIQAIDNIVTFFGSYGAKITFAVPGELILTAPQKFIQIYNAGHEFIGHGFKKHSDIFNGNYISTLYYHKLTDEEIHEDITRGNLTIENVFGSYPRGFRIPHFGHSDDIRELNRVYKVLHKYHISYSSSTLPWRGIIKGPIYMTNYGLYELPVTGSWENPFQVLDTYSFGFHPQNKKSFQDYYDNIMNIGSYYADRPVCLNLYCDPSQAVQMKGWFKAMKKLLSLGYNFITIGEFVDNIMANEI